MSIKRAGTEALPLQIVGLAGSGTETVANTTLSGIVANQPGISNNGGTLRVNTFNFPKF